MIGGGWERPNLRILFGSDAGFTASDLLTLHDVIADVQAVASLTTLTLASAFPAGPLVPCGSRHGRPVTRNREEARRTARSGASGTRERDQASAQLLKAPFFLPWPTISWQ